MQAVQFDRNDPFTTESERGPILCVQLPEDVVSEVRLLAECTPIQTYAFLDQSKIEEQMAKAAMLLCFYDGPNGMAKTFVAAIRDKAKDLPIFLIVPPQFHGDTLKSKKLKVTSLFLWPRESAKFASCLYDVIHHAGPVDDNIESNGVSDFELSEATRVERLESVRLPGRQSDQAIITYSLEEIEHRKKLQQEMLELKELNPHFFLGRVCLFHPDAAGALGFKRQLRSGGIPNCVTATSISQMFHYARGENLSAVVAWYDGEHDDTINLLREINAARSLRPLAVVVVTPGETALSRFEELGSDLVYDQVICYEKVPSQFVKRILVGVQIHRDSGSLSNRLAQVRLASRNALPGTKRHPMDPPKLTELLQPLKDKDGLKYWAEAEEVLQLLLKKDVAAAAKLADNFSAKNLDALCLKATVKAWSEGGEAAGRWLVDQALNHRQLNLERCYSIARSLGKWKAREALAEFLLEWHNREDLPVDHQFYFHLSIYFGQQGDTDLQLRSLSQAIKESPLRDEYLYALLEFFRMKKDLRREEDVWRVLSVAPGVNPLFARYQLARVLVELRKNSEALKLLGRILQVKPGFKPAQLLKKKVGG